MKRLFGALICLCLGAGAFAQTAEPVAETPAPPPSPSPASDIASILDSRFKMLDEPLAEGEPDGAAQSLSVDEAVALAREQNPRTAIAQSDVRAAQARIGQAQAQRMPQVKGEAGATYIDDVSVDFGPPFLQRIIGMPGGSQTVSQEQISVSQVLFAGGQIRAAIRASKFLAESQEWQREATLDDLELEVREAYYNVLLARALQRVADESVTTFERHLADSRRMREAGVISGFEVLRAQTELGTRQSDAVAASNGVRLAKANLRRVLALPANTPSRLSGSTNLEPFDESSAELVKMAHERRPELLALEQGQQAAAEDVKRTKGQFLPRVAATAKYGNTDGGSVFGASQEGFTATLGAEIDIYAGGRRKYEVAESKERLSNLEAQVRDVKNLVELDVTRALIQFQDAVARVHSEQGNVDLAREGLRLAEIRFQEGVGTQSETLDASLALTSAESALVRSLHEYAVAHAGLQRAVGKDPESTDAGKADALSQKAASALTK